MITPLFLPPLSPSPQFFSPQARKFLSELLNNVELSSNLYIAYLIILTLFLDFPVKLYGP